MKCSACGIKEAIWKHLRLKNPGHNAKYLCDECLMKHPLPSELLDNYKYCGD